MYQRWNSSIKKGVSKVKTIN